MNYQIIKDEQKLREFIDWLPELKPTEKYYLCLFTRSKYTKDDEGVNGLPHIKSDKAQLKRFVSDKERMYQKIKQLEIEEGGYWQKDLIIPEKALALYITVNPRDTWKATFNSLIKLSQCIRDNNILSNPHQEVMSEIQRTRGTGYYVDFDIDVNGPELFEQLELVKGLVNKEALTVIKTRGGAHCLINPKKVEPQFVKSWYTNIKKLAFVDQAGDTMIPVVGCTQGNFIPHFLDVNDISIVNIEQ